MTIGPQIVYNKNWTFCFQSQLNDFFPQALGGMAKRTEAPTCFVSNNYLNNVLQCSFSSA